MSRPDLPIRRMGYLLAFVTAVLAFLTANSSFGGGDMDWKVRIAPASAVSGERVMLGEIGEPIGQMDPETWRILAATPLWHFPGREGQLTLSRTQVLDDLDKLFPNAERNFHVPAQIVLRKGGGKPVATNDINKMIVDYLTANMTGLDGEIEVKEIVMPNQLFVDDQLERVSVDSVGQLTPGRVNLRLNIANLEGKMVRQVAVNAFVNLWKVIPVSAKPINPREGAITSDMITYERRNMAFVRGIPWDFKDPMPMRVKSSVNQGTPLTADYIEPMPAISRGDRITCLWRGPHVQLTIPVIALTNGAKGGPITVRNVQGGKEIAAMVQDNQTVLAR